MRVTVLGSSASYAASGHACAGYLVESGTTRVLFDCGNGTLANLTAVMDPTALDAVFVSHIHPDHFLDLYALQAALRYAPEGPASALALYTPAGLFERMKCLLSERGARELDEAFMPGVLTDGLDVIVGDLTVTPIAVEHAAPSFALRAAAAEVTFAYSGDVGPGEWVGVAIASADLAIVEATLPERYAGHAPHLTATEAGRFARDAGVRKLVLTHLWPTIDRDSAAADAETTFGGPVRVACEFDTFDISGEGIS